MKDKPLILAVDDTPENLDLLASFLSEDYCLKVATNGSRALELATEQDVPDLILLDIMMPEMDGYEVMRRLKQTPVTAQVPVIFLTAMAEALDEEKGFDLGAVDYITKPFNPYVVLARVRTHLSLKQTRDQLMEQRDTLEENLHVLSELEKFRDDLVHMVAHDMHSPLRGLYRSVDSAVGSLQEKNGFSKEVKLLQSARSAVQMLDNMIVSLIDVSKLEKAEFPLQRTPCNLGDLCQAVAQKMNSITGAPRVRLNTESVPVITLCDEAVFQRILFNLIDNAFKFSPAGESIDLTLSSRDRWVEVAVEDHGPGIPETCKNRIFDKFEQVKAHQDGAQFSAGLGLTFCKLAAEALGGCISVENAEGGGASFLIRLPLETAKGNRGVPEKKEPVQVLLVDEQRQVTTALKRYLEQQTDWLVSVLNNSGSAVSTVLRTAPDLLVLEVNMSGKSGGDIVKELTPYLDVSLKTKIIYFTSLVRPEESKSGGYKKGERVVPVISKGLPLKSFVKIMEDHLTPVADR